MRDILDAEVVPFVRQLVFKSNFVEGRFPGRDVRTVHKGTLPHTSACPWSSS